MRSVAWMVFLGFVVGCGASLPPTVAIDPPAVSPATFPEPAIPEEVRALFTRGEITKAIDTLTAMIEKTPRDENLYVLRATAYHRLRESERALTDLDHAIELNNRDPRIYNNRGFIRMGLEQFEAALNDFDKATELAPNYKNSFNNRGLLFVAQRRYDDAIEQFNRAIEIDHQYVDAYNNRGFAEFESGQISKALDDFNIAIDLNPDYVNAYNNRGLLCARAGDYKNAVIDFKQAILIDPLNPKYYEHRRDVYQKQREYRKMVEDENKIEWLLEYHELTAEIASNPDPAEELVARAKHFLRVDDYDKALDDLDRAIALDGTLVDALVARANVHLHKKSMPEARADAEAVLGIASREEAYSVLGDVFLHEGEYERAIENYTRAERVDENVADAYYCQAKVLDKQGQSEQAKSLRERALVLDPEVEHRIR